MATTAPPPTKTVTLTIDGRELTVSEGTLEETMRMTSICGLGQVALGPVISVLGLPRAGTEARPHPRAERAPEEGPSP